LIGTHEKRSPGKRREPLSSDFIVLLLMKLPRFLELGQGAEFFGVEIVGSILSPAVVRRRLNRGTKSGSKRTFESIKHKVHSQGRKKSKFEVK
jgi:hypothetical protein